MASGSGRAAALGNSSLSPEVSPRKLLTSGLLPDWVTESGSGKIDGIPS